MAWTPEREALARQLYIVEGHSAAQTALKLGGGVSRNAVIGVAFRRGWLKEGRQKPAKPTMVRPPRAPKVKAAPKNKPPHPGPQKKPAMVFGVTFLETPASDEQRAVFRKVGLTTVERVEQGFGVESPDARPFLEAKRGCKWPLAGGMVCCSLITRGVYCEGHAEVAYVRRDRTGTALRRESGVEAYAPFLTRHERIDSYRKVRPANDVAPTPWDSGRAAA